MLSSFEIINETFKEIAPLIQDKTTNSQPNKEQKIEAPIIKLFCAIVHQSKLIVKDIDESPEKFITKVINEYSIKANPARARQYFDAEIDITKKDQKEYLSKVIELILPNIEPVAKQQIETYLQSKNLYA